MSSLKFKKEINKDGYIEYIVCKGSMKPLFGYSEQIGIFYEEEYLYNFSKKLCENDANIMLEIYEDFNKAHSRVFNTIKKRPIPDGAFKNQIPESILLRFWP